MPLMANKHVEQALPRLWASCLTTVVTLYPLVSNKWKNYLIYLWCNLNYYIFYYSICRFGGVPHCRTRHSPMVAVLPVFHRFHTLLLLTLADLRFWFVNSLYKTGLHNFRVHEFTYALGTLRFGKVDVTEAQFGIMTLHMVTFFFGGDIWNLHVSTFYFVFTYILFSQMLRSSHKVTGNRLAIVRAGEEDLFTQLLTFCIPPHLPHLFVHRLVADIGSTVRYCCGHRRLAVAILRLFQRICRHDPQRWFRKERINHCRKLFEQRPFLHSPLSLSLSCTLPSIKGCGCTWWWMDMSFVFNTLKVHRHKLIPFQN